MALFLRGVESRCTMNERSVVKVVEFGNREGERGTERVKCLLCRGGGDEDHLFLKCWKTRR